jgi:hypothetical protein
MVPADTTRARPPAATGRPASRHRSAVASADPQLHLELARKLSGLPRDLGVALISLGLVGVAIPGPVPLGSTFVVLGTVVLCPGLVGRTAGPLARRCPRVFRVLLDFTEDFRDDLERRYPGSLTR